MSAPYKTAESLTIRDLETHPVWEYVNEDAAGETAVRSVRSLPARTLDGRLAGTRVRLVNGTSLWALIGNVDVRDARLTEHFLTLSLLWHGRWLTLARYHDFDYADRGPEALASSLGLDVDEVFPITYDLTGIAEGDPTAITGAIPKEPRERLTKAEIIALAVR